MTMRTAAAAAAVAAADTEIPKGKGEAFAFKKRISLRSRIFARVGGQKNTLSVQSVFSEVHALGKND